MCATAGEGLRHELQSNQVPAEGVAGMKSTQACRKQICTERDISMRKSIFTISILMLMLGILVGTSFASKSKSVRKNTAATTSLVIKISPSTIVIGSDQEWVTVNTNIPYGDADCASLTLNDVAVAWTKADDLGTLVAKFDYKAIAAIVSPPSATLTFKGLMKSGEAFEASGTVAVKTAGPR